MPTTEFSPAESTPIRTALVGYGNAGRIFHAPLISSVPALQLYTVVSSKAAQVLADWPTVRVVAALEEALADPSVDLVVIATGNDSHFSLAQSALHAGKHVVVDKPCTVTMEQTESLLALARQQGRVLTVFQNRRWDADFLTLRQVLDSGVLGRICYFESHFDRYRPVVPDRWREKDLPGSGLWFDLGSHLVDQALCLFGAPQGVLLDLGTQRDGAQVNDYFHAVLRYPQSQDLRVVLHGSALVPAVGPRFVVHGTRGSYVKYGLDGQEDALKAGGRPGWGRLQDWGHDPVEGVLTTYEGSAPQTRAVPNLQGSYPSFYASLAESLRGGCAEPEVTASMVEQAMRMLTLGERSAREGRWL